VCCHGTPTCSLVWAERNRDGCPQRKVRFMLHVARIYNVWLQFTEFWEGVQCIVSYSNSFTAFAIRGSGQCFHRLLRHLSLPTKKYIYFFFSLVKMTPLVCFIHLIIQEYDSKCLN
jgi:hypothetical protein